MAIVYGLKVNLSVAMVIMVNNTALKTDPLIHEATACNDTLADLRQSLVSQPTMPNQTSSFLNQTTLLESIKNQADLCHNIAQQLANLTNFLKSDAEKSEVCIHKKTVQIEIG